MDLKIYVEQKKCIIDCKEYEYDSFYTCVNLPVVGIINIILPIKSKNEKQLLKGLLDVATVELLEKISEKTGSPYYIVNIVVALSSKIEIRVPLDNNAIALLRIALGSK